MLQKKSNLEKLFLLVHLQFILKNIKKNIKEKFLCNFLPHKSELNYGLSKRIFYYQLATLKEQYKINFTYIILNNIYGKYDNFNIETGHVIPALIHKFYLAKINNVNLTILGKKNDRRCFLNASDAANVILKLIKKKLI